MIERKAQDIINDKYLSERTKRYRIKQLLNSRNVEKNMSRSAFNMIVMKLLMVLFGQKF